MSTHESVLVPLATSHLQAPNLYTQGVVTDVGLFAEALLYYDSIYVKAGNTLQFANFVSTLIQNGVTYSQLINLVETGVVRFVTTVSVHPYVSKDPLTGSPRTDIINSFYTIQEEGIANSDYFEKKYLDSDALRSAFSALSSLNEREYARFCDAAKKSGITLDADVVALGIVENAYQDFLDPDRYKRIATQLLQPLFKMQSLGAVPDFAVRVRELDAKNIDAIAKNLGSTIVGRNFDDDRYKIYEVDAELPIRDLKDSETLRRIFHTLPLTYAGVADLYIRTAGVLKTDFYLADPISNFIGDKIYELNLLENKNDQLKKQGIVGKLEHSVRFPDLRSLVNSNQIDFQEILKIRDRASRFRTWLQTTNASGDYEVLAAYHNEVIKESGLEKAVRKSLSIFGFLVSSGVGAATGHFLTDNPTAGFVTGALVNEIGKDAAKKISEKLFDYGANIGKDWKPICFGNWYKHRLEVLTKIRD